MSLQRKTVLPSAGLIVVLGVIGYLIMQAEFAEFQHALYANLLAQKQHEIQATIEMAARESLEKAALFSRLPAVLDAYALARGGDINDERDPQAQAAREKLRRDLQPHMAGYAAVMDGRKFKLHFHLPNGRSLVRLWRDKQEKRDGEWVDVSDDISSFRQTVLDVNRSGKPVMGVEIGRGGFDIRGVAPVLAPDGKPLGSVEVQEEMAALLNAVGTADRRQERLLLLMNAEQQAITTELQDPQRYPVVAQKYVLLYRSSEAETLDAQDAALLNRARAAAIFENHAQRGIGAFPVRDYRGRQIGLVVCLFDMREQVRLAARVKWAMMGTLTAILLVFAAVSMFITHRYVLRPVKAIAGVADCVREGDYRCLLTADGGDEMRDMARALNAMIDAQRDTIEQIQRSTIQISSSATELSATAKQQEATIIAQVESTQNVLSSIEEITAVATELVETMEQVSGMSQQTAEVASSGQADLAKMADVMAQMGAASLAISQRLQTINQQAENITTVVTTITRVADQTNLLSLNAAIEAEKAGESGRGFTVVAQEIRRLADQTAVATLDIEQMVKEMQAAVASGVLEMERFIAQVGDSAADVQRIGGQLTRIIEQVQALSPTFDHVNIGVGRQSQHTQNINAAVLRLSEGMRETKEALHETFLAIEQLNEAARSLRDHVSRFRVNND